MVDNYVLMWTYLSPCERSSTQSVLLDGAARQHTLEGLEENSTYSFRLQARNSAVVSPDAVLEVATLSAAPSGPPQSLQGISTTPTSITIEWNDIICLDQNGAITSYDVRVNGRVVLTTFQRQATITGLSSSTSYFIDVRGNNSIGGGPFSPTARITTAGAENVSVSFDQSEYTVSEGETVFVGVRLSGPVSVQTVVRLLTIDGTAEGLEDYILSDSSVTFAPGVFEQFIPILTVNDSIGESDETFDVVFSPISSNVIIGAIPISTIVIIDDDPNFSLECIQFTVSPSGPFQIACQPMNGEVESVECDYNSGLTDEPCGLSFSVDLTQFEPGPLTLTITATSTEGETDTDSFTFTVPEPLSLECSSGGVSGRVTVSCTTSRGLFQPPFCELTGPGVGVIEPCDLDNIELSVVDFPPGAYNLTISVVDVLELTATETVLVFLTEPLFDISCMVNGTTVTCSSTVDGTMVLVSYECSIDGETAMSCEPPFTIASETLKAGSHNLTIMATTLRGQTRLIDIPFIIGVVIGFEETTYTTNEPNPTLEVCAVLFEGILGRDVVVTASTDDGTARAPDDYTATIAPLTFNIGEPVSTRKCFNIPIINDTIFEGTEDFIGNLVTDEPRVELNPDRTLINILDDDGLTIGFINPPYSGVEGDGIATLTVAVTSGEIMSGLSVVVNLSTSDLPISPGVFPAVGDVDYVPITDLQLTFTSDITQITINASLVDDSIVEYDESFQASLTFATAGTNAAFSDDQENVLIIDDDRITIGLDETFIQVSEDIGVREVCASITDGETQKEIVVTLTSEDESAEAGSDFEGVDVDLVFDQFTDQVCTNLIIFSDDLYEGSERFNLNLTTDETFVDLSPDSSVVEIIDQDNIVVGWVQELYEVPESAGVAELCAEISQGTLAIDLPGILASFPPGSASSGDDYFDLADFQFLFEAGGPTILCVDIPIIDDDLVEIPEDFFGELAFIEVPADNVLIDPGLTTVIIINDNDTAVIGFLETEYSINEDDSPAVLRVGIIEGTLAVDVVVGLTTGDDTAIAGEDYNSLVANLTFIGGPGTEENPSVVIINDDIDEPDIESFIASLVRLTDLDRVTISPDLANVNIIDDDEINECIMETDDCVDGALCVKTLGSFTCTCPSGFTGDGRESGSGCRADTMITCESTVVLQSTRITCTSTRPLSQDPPPLCVIGTTGGFCDISNFVVTTDVFPAGNLNLTITAQDRRGFMIVHTFPFVLIECDPLGAVRLVGGSNGMEGRVEVCDGVVWGTVCDDQWDNQDAMVVCRQLGLPTQGAIARTGSFFGQGSGPIVLDNVQCTGSETRILDCTANPIGVHNCNHDQDAGVTCVPSTPSPTTPSPATPPDELVECFVDQDCFQDATPLEVTRRECCVGNPAGAGFRLVGDEGCNVCIVFGFFNTTFTAPEQGQGYSLPVGYLKRPRTGVVALPFTVSEELLNTTTPADFTLQTVLVAVLPNQDSRDVTFTFQVDGIAQELDETVRLKLSVSQAILNRLPGDLDNSVYFLDTADVVILDSDSLEIQFTEPDYRNGEAELMLPVRVNKNQRIATPVTVRVTPSTLTQHRLTGRPDPPGTLDDDPDAPIEADLNDFDNTPIEVTFQPDDTGDQMDDVDTPISIINDVINEATEQNFVVTVEIVSAFDTSRISIAREDSLGRIIDDDAISIGFQQPSYNFDEPPDAGDSETITGDVLLEKENGVISEQTFSILVTVTPTTPNQAIGPAERTDDMGDNDYTIGASNFIILIMDPNEQTVSFNFRLFGDDIAEGTEAFQATSTRLEETPEYLPPTVLSPSTFILIEDDDMITIGFERNYTVTESVGMQEICAVVTFPAPDVPILSDITLSVNTMEGTANEMDYDRIAESDGLVFLSFDDVNRRACFNLQINDDGLVEDTEILTIDLVFSSFFPAPSSVILNPNVTNVTILGIIPCNDGEVRLRDGFTEREGRVEICFDSEWGTVCDDRWDDNDAAVVCRQLGFSSGDAIAVTDAFYGLGVGPIHLDEVQCNGDEARLADCTHNGIGNENCEHFEDAGVEC